METIDIKFVPSFEVSVTEKDLFEYYKENNITNYPKKANGMPIMKRKFNATHIQSLHNKKAMMIEEQYEEYIKNGLKKKHTEILKMKMDECKTCVICSDEMKSISMLECGHTMCVKCTISHFRVNHTCPFCRAIVSEKPRERHIMQNHTLDALVDNNLESIEEARYNLTMLHYIRNRLTTYKAGVGLNVNEFARNIVREIRLSMIDLGGSINAWYL
jgi:hypothetical protein